MDKETLSNYGWIVVCVMVLAVMIALATPFGTYIKNATLSTQNGLIETNELALGAVGIGSRAKLEMLDGAGQTYETTSTELLTFRSEADLADFKEVRVDGATVDGSNYTLSEGSTVVTFNEDYSKALADGTHTVEIISNTGTASADFTVKGPTPEQLIEQGIVPEGGTYYVGVQKQMGNYESIYKLGNYTGATATYTTGQNMPTASTGDVFVYGDYEYRYNMSYTVYENYDGPDVTAQWRVTQSNGWGVRVLDSSKTAYGTIMENINNRTLTDACSAFAECFSLITAPEIPTTATMDYIFSGCTSLVDASKVVINGSENTRNGWATFRGCSSLTTPPTIASGVELLQSTFNGCTSLTGTIEIPCTVANVIINNCSATFETYHYEGCGH